ncbi:MAG: helix-turn-helix domain-containing protein [Propionivibrio sp.]|uniref:helix-turn-helix domain-containing protein n=1 Tax=Propionivibrio sp. TaxID=2212460 RepID=UPI001B623096|nr:helix-turn-helix domain-containing protein [Propionivibrio sp.]
MFRASLGQTAREYWQELRLQYVRWRLLNSDHRLATLADEAGFQDASHLRKAHR